MSSHRQQKIHFIICMIPLMCIYNIFSWLCIQVSANQHLFSSIALSFAVVFQEQCWFWQQTPCSLWHCPSNSWCFVGLDTSQSLFTSAKSVWSLLSTRNWDIQTGKLKSSRISHVFLLYMQTVALCSALVWFLKVQDNFRGTFSCSFTVPGKTMSYFLQYLKKIRSYFD